MKAWPIAQKVPAALHRGWLLHMFLDTDTSEGTRRPLFALLEGLVLVSIHLCELGNREEAMISIFKLNEEVGVIVGP